MVRAWYLEPTGDNDLSVSVPGDEQLLNQEEVTTTTGVRIYHITISRNPNDPVLHKLKQDIGIRYEDVIVIKEGKPEYRNQVRVFGTEHLHPDDEIRWLETGVTYYDVRTLDDGWVRLELSKGDLIVLPAGLYHRLVLAPGKTYLKMRRYFASESRWAGHRRPADDHPARRKYLAAMGPEVAVEGMRTDHAYRRLH
ncbi:hypothetical protein NP493_466g02002 [Ridgeia piscesae]|uniref:acireductone dioxygenase (Fe(2+)-requiring) n=1 Tax=Ridgeia piscesae TaxID=27915 RepID=A0AAD9NTB9_RIDPI|nr:hypothetical protein NP493_466g02002 [Ridgeia piscesae]